MDPGNNDGWEEEEPIVQVSGTHGFNDGLGGGTPP